jgi:hypothetical protein
MRMIGSVSSPPALQVQPTPQTPKAVTRDGDCDGNAPNAGVVAAQDSCAPNRALNTTA